MSEEQQQNKQQEAEKKSFDLQEFGEEVLVLLDEMNSHLEMANRIRLARSFMRQVPARGPNGEDWFTVQFDSDAFTKAYNHLASLEAQKVDDPQ